MNRLVAFLIWPFVAVALLVLVVALTTLALTVVWIAIPFGKFEVE